MREARLVFSGPEGRIVLKLDADSEARHGEVKLSLRSEPVEGGGVRVRLVLESPQAIRLEEACIDMACAVGPADRVFANGFQSWTDSREFRPDERIPGLPYWLKPLWARHRLEPYGDYFRRKYEGRYWHLHAYSYMSIRRPNGDFRLLASLDEGGGYTVFELDTYHGHLRIEKDVAGAELQGRVTLCDVFVGEGLEEAVFDAWWELQGMPRPRVGRAVGWTSWYLHYTDVSEAIVLENLNAFSERKVPLQVFQVDDGWQRAVGDWLDVNEKFPRGMQALAADIRSRGYKPGLWLAPFVCDSRSRILKEHPEWVLKDEQGAPLAAGNSDLWGGPFFALDSDHPGVRAYLTEVFRTVTGTWGFELVKLDFLYAAGLRHKPGRPRAKVMRDAMEFLRSLVGEKLILGCGVPLAPAFGLVDYCRIGPDVSLGWEEQAPALIHYRERISTITAITNSIGRRHLDGRAFVNDPDVFILRDLKTTLTHDERNTLFVANAVFGNLIFTSDDIRTYNAQTWSRFCSLFPSVRPHVRSVRSLDGVYSWTLRSTFWQALRGVKPYANVLVAEFGVDERSYVAVFNLGDRMARVALGPGFCFDGQDIRVGEAEVPPHGAQVLLRLSGNEHEALGGVGHVFPGCEVAYCEMAGNRISVGWAEGTLERHPVFVRVPQGGSWEVNGKMCEARTRLGCWLVTANP